MNGSDISNTFEVRLTVFAYFGYCRNVCSRLSQCAADRQQQVEAYEMIEIKQNRKPGKYRGYNVGFVVVSMDEKKPTHLR